MWLRDRLADRGCCRGSKHAIVCNNRGRHVAAMNMQILQRQALQGRRVGGGRVASPGFLKSSPMSSRVTNVVNRCYRME